MLRKSILLLCLFILLIPEIIFTQIDIQSCLSCKPIKIVILGSSTATGKGASNPDSSWVGRYRNHLLIMNNFNKVINLAVSGYTTYELMPDEFNPPDSRPFPDTAHNISAALAHSPDAIIINLPSNDIAKGFDVSEQLINFDSLVNYAQQYNVPVWVCTPQPRYMNSSQLRRQRLVMEAFLSRYKEYTINFWNEIAAATGYIDNKYDAGDGAHLNDHGHKILFYRVLNKMIPKVLFNPKPFPDYTCFTYNPHKINKYTDSIQFIDVIVTNLGLVDPGYFMLTFKAFDITKDQYIQQSNIQLKGFNTCESDTIRFSVLTKPDHHYSYQAFTRCRKDKNKENDSLLLKYVTTGISSFPNVTSTNNKLLLRTYGFQFDSVFWCDIHTQGHIAGTPDIFESFKDNASLSNGISFDIATHCNPDLETIKSNIFTIGSKNIEIIYQRKSHNNEGNKNIQWLKPENDTLLTFNRGKQHIIKWNLVLQTNDTIAVVLRNKGDHPDFSYYNHFSFNNDFQRDFYNYVKGNAYSEPFFKPYSTGSFVYETKTVESLHMNFSNFMTKGFSSLIMQPINNFKPDNSFSKTNNVILDFGNQFEMKFWHDIRKNVLYMATNTYLPLKNNSISFINTYNNSDSNNETMKIELIVDPGIFRLPSDSNITPKPNPNHGIFSISNPSKKRYIDKISLSSFSGKKFKINNIQWINNESLHIEADVPVSGLYLLRVRFEEKTYKIPIYVIK